MIRCLFDGDDAQGAHVRTIHIIIDIPFMRLFSVSFNFGWTDDV